MRSFGRSFLAFAVSGLFLAACGQATANPAVIGVRPGVGAGSVPADQSAAFAAIESRLADELAQANAVGNSNPGGAAGVIPIDVNQSLSQVERIQALQQLGSSQINTAISKLQAQQAQVNGDTTITGAQKQKVDAWINRSIAALQALESKINDDTTLDLTRNDVTGIANLHVDGVVLPVARYLQAAYQMLELLTQYQASEQGLKQDIANAEAAGVQVPAAVSDVADMDVQMATMQRSADAALGVLPYVDPTAYPGNKDTIDNAHVTLLAGRVASVQAGTDAIDARQVLDAAHASVPMVVK